MHARQGPSLEAGAGAGVMGVVGVWVWAGWEW